MNEKPVSGTPDPETPDPETPDRDAIASIAALIRSGYGDRIRVLREPARSAAEAARQLGCPVGAIANSIVFEAGSRPLLVLVSGAHRADTRVLRSHAGGVSVKRASAAFVLASTGQEPGSVAPVGHPRAITTLIDSDLRNFDAIWAGAGTESSLFFATLAELIALTGGTVVDVAAGR